MSTTYRLLAALSICLTVNTAIAQDARPLTLTPPRFTAETTTAQAAAQAPILSAVDPQRTSPRISKTKWTLILVGAAAVVTGILLARSSSSNHVSTGGSPSQPTGPLSSVVVINGVPQ